MTEVEIKLSVGPTQPVACILEALGAVLEHPRGFEENVLLDLPGKLLAKRGSIMRVRSYGGEGTVAFKSPASGPEGFKARGEIETHVAEPAQMIQILEGAGFSQVWKYVKYRTLYRRGALAIMLDETPVGNYLELEGAPDAIDAFAARLGRSPSEYITANYRTLQENWCRERGLVAGDLLFEQEATK